MRETLNYRQPDIFEMAQRVISSLNLEEIKLSLREMKKFLKNIGLNKKGSQRIINFWREAIEDGRV